MKARNKELSWKRKGSRGQLGHRGGESTSGHLREAGSLDGLLTDTGELHPDFQKP